MWSLTKRELLTFFTTPLGYSILALFFVLNALLLWIFDNSFNTINSGFADLNLYFELMPWLFLFLIPAIGMKAFSEEIRTGTIELLFAKPITLWELVIGKFTGIFILVLFSIFGSLIYVFSILKLKLAADVFDWGSYWGSFVGLNFLASIFISITLLISCIFKNPVIAFLAALILCFIHYYGWGELSLYFTDNTFYSFINAIGIRSHYSQMSKGIIDSKDLVYFVGQLFLILFLTVIKLKKLKK